MLFDWWELVGGVISGELLPSTHLEMLFFWVFFGGCSKRSSRDRLALWFLPNFLGAVLSYIPLLPTHPAMRPPSLYDDSHQPGVISDVRDCIESLPPKTREQGVISDHSTYHTLNRIEILHSALSGQKGGPAE